MAISKITTKGIADDSVTSAKLAAGAVTINDIPDGEITMAKLSQVNLDIAPEILEIQVAAPAAGQDIAWLWTWEQSTLPYARRTITNSPEVSVPLYKQGTYTVNNYAAYDLFGDMTQTHTLYFKWIDSAGTDNLISWATSTGPVSDSHPDINSGNATDVQRISINVPATITLPTLTPPNVSYSVTNNGSGAYTFSGSAAGDNPNIGPMYRGGTYTFNVNAVGHPLYFTTDNGTNFSSGTYFGEYTDGVTGSRTDNGTVTIVVPSDAPDTLYYQCGNHSSMRGAITIKDLAVEVNNNGNYVVYAMHTQEGHKTPIELRPIPSLVNQMCLVYDAASGKFVPQDLATYVENTPSFENKIREVAGTAELVVEDGSAVIAKVNVYDDSTYLPLVGNNPGDQAFATDTDILYIWDGSAWQQAGAANTDDLAEGTTNLFYTDARVGTYLSANGYDTATNIVASITDSAPATLDTLNELAAALGDDPNFATTVSTQIGTKLDSADFTKANIDALGIDADTFDGVNSNSYVRRDGATHSVGTSGNIDNFSGFGIYRNYSTGDGNNPFASHHNILQIPNTSSTIYDIQLAFETTGSNTYADGGFKWRQATAGTWSDWHKVWHEANDGSGSGLDADTVDGLQASSFLRGDVNSDTMNGLLVFSGNSGEITLTLGSKASNGILPSLATNHASVIAEYELINSTISANLVLDVGGSGKIKLNHDTVIDGNLEVSGHLNTGSWSYGSTSTWKNTQQTDRTLRFGTFSSDSASYFGPNNDANSHQKIDLGVGDGQFRNASLSGTVTAGNFSGNGATLSNIFVDNRGYLGGSSSVNVGDTGDWPMAPASGTYVKSYSGHSGNIVVFKGGGSTGTVALECTYYGDIRYHSNTDSNRWTSAQILTDQYGSFRDFSTPTTWSATFTSQTDVTIDVSAQFGVPDTAKAILVTGYYHISGYSQGAAGQGDHALSMFKENNSWSGTSPWSFNTSSNTGWGCYVLEHDGDASGSPHHFGAWGYNGIIPVNGNGNIYGRLGWGLSGGTHYNTLWCFGYWI